MPNLAALPDPIGLASFPGVGRIVRASYTLSHGITPGAARIEIAPQANLPARDGPFSFAFAGGGFNVLLTFPFCRVDRASLIRDEAGDLVAFDVWDRRWKWQYTLISGRYNVRLGENSIDPKTQRTPQQLAAILLDAMGESGYSVAGLSHVGLARPEVVWDRDTAAQELAELCERYGCRVCYGLDNRVRIVRTGEGAPLPDLPGRIISRSASIDPPENPDFLLWASAATEFQVCFGLEPVGLDTDGQTKKIDDLSYKPPGGWEKQNPGTMGDVDAGAEPTEPGQYKARPRDLALRTVWKQYRITGTLAGTKEQIAKYLKLKKPLPEGIEIFLPLGDELVQTYTDNDGKKRRKPAIISGEFSQHALGKLGNTKKWEAYRLPFRILGERGIVEFQHPVYKVDPNNGDRKPADIVLCTTCNVRTDLTAAYARFEETFTFAGTAAGTGPRVLKHDEAEHWVRIKYDSAGKPTGVTHNDAEVLAQAKHDLIAAALEYETASPLEVTYDGIIPINPDGAIQQITWEVVEGQGATTRASRNDEHEYRLPSYKERRLWERVRNDQLRAAEEQAKQRWARFRAALANTGPFARPSQ